jgi:hypothetical protein
VKSNGVNLPLISYRIPSNYPTCGKDVFQKSIILPIFRDMSRAREEAAQASRFLTGAACWKAIRCISQFVPLADE